MFPADEFDARLQVLKTLMKENGINGLILYSDSLCNGYVSWLTFYNNIITWSNAVLIVKDDAPIHLIASIPQRDEKRVKNFVIPNLDVEYAGLSLVANDGIGAYVASYIKEKGWESGKWWGVNLREMPHMAYGSISDILGEVGDFTKEYDLLRSKKTHAEMEAISKAASIAREMATEFIEEYKRGTTQKEISAYIDKKARYADAEDIRIFIGEDEGKGILHLPDESEFMENQLVRLFIQVQYMRYIAVHGITFFTGGEVDKLKQDSALLEKIDTIITELNNTRVLPKDYKEHFGFEPDSFSSIQGIGMDASEMPNEQSCGWQLEGGNVIHITVDEKNEKGKRILVSETFYCSQTGLVPASSYFYAGDSPL